MLGRKTERSIPSRKITMEIVHHCNGKCNAMLADLLFFCIALLLKK